MQYIHRLRQKLYQNSKIKSRQLFADGYAIELLQVRYITILIFISYGIWNFLYFPVLNNYNRFSYFFLLGFIRNQRLIMNPQLQENISAVEQKQSDPVQSSQLNSRKLCWILILHLWSKEIC